MDNASKALLMAAGILIAVMVVGVAMYILSSARGIAYDANKQAEQSAIESFNRYYQSFGTSPCKVEGIDCLNIYNKAVDTNITADESGSLYVIDVSGVDTSIINSLSAPEGIQYMDKQYNFEYSDNDDDGYIDHIRIYR